MKHIFQPTKHTKNTIKRINITKENKIREKFVNKKSNKSNKNKQKQTNKN